VVNPRPPEPTAKELLLAELAAEEELLRRVEYDKASQFGPNRTQWSFANHELQIHESLFSGPNQAGKTSMARYIAGKHLTGDYPPGWTGPKFDLPIQCVLAGETAETVRDLFVNELLGRPESRGSGYLPADSFDPKKDIKRLGGGVPDQVSYFRVKHYTDGIFDGYSVAYCSQYSKGWRRFQGYALDLIMIDEEPPFDVYDELSARINKTGGYMYICLTPLQGETDLYMLFERDETGERRLLHYDIDDATHMTEEERQRLKNKYENHPLREARLHGRPVRGRGIVYPTAEVKYVINDCADVLSPYWHRIIGIDIPHGAGFFAAVKMVYDQDSDILYITNEYKAEGEPWPVYESRLRGLGGEHVPIAWPHDANVRGTDGRTARERLEAANLNVLHDAAAFRTHDGKMTNKIWTAVEEILDRMQTGRLKLFKSCRELRDEIRTYRHEDGKIEPKQNDHLIDAMHKAVMMLRHAEPGDADVAAAPADQWAESWENYDFFAS
jgi:phage terminase large subunit-like protein